MKKILILILFIFLLTGCSSNKDTKKVVKEKKKEPVKVEEKYIDNNNTPISFYEVNNRKLTKIHSTSSTIGREIDVGVYTIYLSNEEEINLNDSYANSFYNEWIKYNKDNKLKIGFNIKYSDVSFNILSPDNCFDHVNDIMTYLYDDYANRGKSFYSHIEKEQYTDSSLFTSIKLQASVAYDRLLPKIELTAFTYDSEDDLINDTYRGNSKYMVTINTN